jgi:hemolysin D
MPLRSRALLVLVPQESQLEIEAMVSNRDIGFVHPGQEAEIKVDTFNSPAMVSRTARC